MYIPKPYEAENDAICRKFIRTNPFGMLVTSTNDWPQITHLPFVLSPDGKTLFSHLAKSNPHLSSQPIPENGTAVFNGPHAYISTNHYEKSRTVPTWNYIAIHVHGNIQVHNDHDMAAKFMSDFIAHIDPSFGSKWQQLDTSYKERMLKEITTFEMEISEIHGAFKLSQDKNEVEQKRIIATLAKEKSDLAGYMQSVLFGD